MRRRQVGTAAALVACLLTGLSARHQDTPEYGPPKGTLVIVGGAMSDASGIAQRFIQLAGGPSKKFVIVPTNGGNRDRQGNLIEYREETVLAAWKRRGLTNVVMLHTADPKVADTEAFVAPLLDADAVWFDGGRQWNMVDSYMHTRTLVEFRKVLDRGGVIAGSSAGATIQGEYLVRGDTSGPDVMMTDGTEPPEGVRAAAQVRDRPAHQRAESVGRPDSRHPEVPRTARDRPVRGHGHHRHGRPVRGAGALEGRGARQHAALSAVGEAVLRVVRR